MDIIYIFPSPTRSCETSRSCPVPGLLLDPRLNGFKTVKHLSHGSEALCYLFCTKPKFGNYIPQWRVLAKAHLQTKIYQSLLAGQKWLYGVVREAKMNRCWRVGDSPGRGEGVFATRRIAAGEVVSSLRPT